MIVGSDIRCNEIIRVLAVVDDVEEEMYAKVLRNTGESVCVTYLSATEKLYKGACVYQLESVAETVQYSSTEPTIPQTEELPNLNSLFS